MARRDYIERLAQERFQGELRDEFLAALRRITDDFEFERIARLIEAGDVESAVQAVGLDPLRFGEMVNISTSAFSAGGAATAAVIGAGFVFNPGNPRAEQAVDELHTGLMRGLHGGPAITEEGIRAIRTFIRRGLEDGKNPRTIARQIRGKYDYRLKAYQGGIIGLTDKQAIHVLNAERQLRSEDPKELRKYLGRKLRDKRFDSIVIGAINGKNKLTETQIQNMVHGYTRKYIRFRSEVVARDQALLALSRGQEEAISQAVAGGVIQGHEVRQHWITAQDDRVRNAHRAIPGMNPGGVRRGESFRTPLGHMRYPRDPQGSAANRIQCRCTLSVRIVKNRSVP